MSAFQSRKFPTSKSKIQSRGFAKGPAKSKKPDGSPLPDRPMTEKARQVRIEELKKELKTLGESESLSLSGTSTWVISDEDNTGYIDKINIIVKSGSLEIEHPSGDYSYTAKLMLTKDNYYEGKWHCYEGNTPIDDGKANAVLYSSGAKHLIMGDWWQDGNKYVWWAIVL